MWLVNMRVRNIPMGVSVWSMSQETTTFQLHTEWSSSPFRRSRKYFKKIAIRVWQTTSCYISPKTIRFFFLYTNLESTLPEAETKKIKSECSILTSPVRKYDQIRGQKKKSGRHGLDILIYGNISFNVLNMSRAFVVSRIGNFSCYLSSHFVIFVPDSMGIDALVHWTYILLG